MLLPYEQRHPLLAVLGDFSDASGRGVDDDVAVVLVGRLVHPGVHRVGGVVSRAQQVLSGREAAIVAAVVGERWRCCRGCHVRRNGALEMQKYYYLTF